MKKLIIYSLLAILIAVGGVFTYAAINANSLVAKYKPDIEKAISQALKSPVTVGTIEASIFPSASLQISQLRVGEKSSQENFTLNNLVFSIKLLKLLTGSLEISELAIKEPEIVIKKSSNGIQIAGLPKNKPQQNKSTPQTTAETTNPSSQGTTLPAGLNLSLNRFSIENARIVYDDLEQKKTYRISKINLDSSVTVNGNLVTLPTLTLTASLLDRIPLSVEGSAIDFALDTQDINISKIVITTLSSLIELSSRYNLTTQKGEATINSPGINLAALKELSEVAPALENLNLQGNLLPRIKVALSSQGAYDAKGQVELREIGATSGSIVVSALQGALAIDATPLKQSVRSDNLSLKLGNAPLTASLDAAVQNNKAILNKLLVKGFSGQIELQANLSLQAAQLFNANLNVTQLQVEQALAALKPETAPILSGTLSEFKTQLSGELGPQLMDSLSGNATINLTNGTLKGINLAGTVLKAVTQIPFLGGALYEAVPPALRGSVDSPDTAIQSLTGNFQIGNAGLRTPDLVLVSQLFSLEADGKVAFDTELDLNSTLLFNQEFSAVMVSRKKDLGTLLDRQGRLIIPLTLNGTPPKIVVYPNVEKLMETGARQALEKGAEKLLDKALRGKGSKNLGKLLGF